MGGARQGAAVLAALAVLAAGVLPAGEARSQATEPPASPQTPGHAILTLDQERLFAESLWGKRVAAGIEADSAALAAENRRIEAELTAEERKLTDERAGMDAAAFRAAADAFDARVTEIRRAQDERAREIGRRTEIERQKFFAAALPALSEALRAQGALVILDRRAIFLAADIIDVTDEMIAAVDKAIGTGLAEEAIPAPPDAAGTEDAPGAAAPPGAEPGADPPGAGTGTAPQGAEPGADPVAPAGQD